MHYMVYRAVAPPGFDLKQYQAHSKEPIRFDAVTVVEADTPQDAINAVIAATGIVSVGMAAVECHMSGYSAESSFGVGGALKAKPPKELVSDVEAATEDADKKLARLEREIDEIRERAD